MGYRTLRVQISSSLEKKRTPRFARSLGLPCHPLTPIYFQLENHLPGFPVTYGAQRHIGWEGEAFSAGLPTPAVAQWGVGHFGWDGECRVGARQDEICSAEGLAHLGVSGSNQRRQTGPTGPFRMPGSSGKQAFRSSRTRKNAALACGVCLADCVARRGRDYILTIHSLSFYFITNQLVNLLLIKLFH